MNQSNIKWAFAILFQEYLNPHSNAINGVINEPTAKQYLIGH